MLFSAHELNQLLGAIDRVLYLGHGQAALGHGRRGDHAGDAVAPLRRADRGGPRRRPHLRHVGRPATSNATHHHDHAHAMTSCSAPSRRAASSRWSPASVGYFLVLRGQTFAGHALSHVGFAGATGAVLIGVSPLWGMLVLHPRRRRRHGAARRAPERARRRHRHRARRCRSASASSSSASTTVHATQATTLLFGNVLAVSPATLAVLVGARRSRRSRRSPSSAGRSSSRACSRSSPRPRACRSAWSAMLFMAMVALAVAAIDRRSSACSSSSP